MPCNINVIYTSLKSTFSGLATGLQFCCRHCGSIFIRLTVVASKNREIPTQFDLIAVQGYPRSSILLSIESLYATSY